MLKEEKKMAATVVVDVPEIIQDRLETLARENFGLWMFIASQDLADEAWTYIEDAVKMPKSFDCWYKNGFICADDQRNAFFNDPF